MANSPLRRTVGVLSSLLLATLFVSGFAGTAHAKDGYRYWNYFHLTGNTWEFSQVGAGDYDPQDGDVEGYRFGTSTASQGITPRADLDEVTFDAICADEEAAAGEKRIAVVLDYGNEADAEGATPPAPVGECAVVDAEADGQQVLQAVIDVRVEGGMTCALAGYPASGCGAPVKDAQVAANEEPVAFDLPATDAASASDDAAASTEEDSDLLWPLVGVGLVVVLIASAALAMNRRKKSV